MKINPVICKKNQVQNFGRALTTEEKKSYLSLLRDAKKELNIQDTCAIVFDFNVPSETGSNTAIGTTWSESMKKFTAFLKDMIGINSIQLQPQGKISSNNTSPYSGTNFAFGEHIIDLGKLTTQEYGSLLPVDYMETIDTNYPEDKQKREYKTDYQFVIGENDNGVQSKALRLAFENFKKGLEEKNPQIIKLNEEMQVFKTDNKDWLERDVLFELFSKHYGTPDFNRWDTYDSNLFSEKISSEQRNDRIKQIKSAYSDEAEFEYFKQFIADKQQKESREFLNSQNIKLYGDCLIGFSQSEMWANKDCFRENLYYGGPDPGCPETNNIQTWGLPALDYTKLGNCDNSDDLSQLGKIGEFLYKKYLMFFKRYDGIRLDAAWQFVTPFIYREINGNYEEFKLPEINFTIFNIMKAAAKKALGNKFDENNPDNIMLELVGISAGKSREMTINTYPHLYTTSYAEYDETPAKFLEKGYKDGKFYTGTGCHDNESLVNLAKDDFKRENHLSGMKQNYNLKTENLKYHDEGYKANSRHEQDLEDFRTAKFAEIFTTSKQFFTLPDMFGMAERINISGKTSPDNWTVRIPSDYERFYFSQLSKGFGLNMPKALANAIQMKNTGNDYLVTKCMEAAEILRSKGPLTTKEADKAASEGKLQHQFVYLS